MNTTIFGVIPARYASSRFPGKPLADIRGKSMIQRVYEQCRKAACLSEVVVATDDERIYDHVAQFGGRVEMTREDHGSGTERVAELAGRYPEVGYFLNIQGDEPFIDPAQIELLGETLLQQGVEIATLVKPLTEVSQLDDQNNAKVVLDHQQNALYFSRAPIPFFKGLEKKAWLAQMAYYLHVGIYGFRRDVLLGIPDLPPSEMERAESLEQLRWLANGISIRVAVSSQTNISVDTPEDLQQLLENL